MIDWGQGFLWKSLRLWRHGGFNPDKLSLTHRITLCDEERERLTQRMGSWNVAIFRPGPLLFCPLRLCGRDTHDIRLWPLIGHFPHTFSSHWPRLSLDLQICLDWRLGYGTVDASDFLLTLMTCPRCLILSADHCPVPMISVSLNTQFPHPHGHRLEECPVSPENAQTRDKICAVRLELREVYTFTLKR